MEAIELNIKLKHDPKVQARSHRPQYWRRRIAGLLIVLLPAVAWGAWSAYQHLGPVAAEGSAPRVVPDSPVYVVILGVDERKNDVGRSDTLMLLRMNRGSETVDLINIPRDTLIKYPDGRTDRINSAYALQGSDLVTQVIAAALDIPRPYYLKLNLKSFEEIVDAVGGVTLTVDRHYQYSDPYQNLEIDIPAGRQSMDGETALKYVRIRFDGVTNDDIARIERQQQFLIEMKNKLSSPMYYLKIPELISTLRSHVTTNIPEPDQIGLAETLFRARANLKMQTLPGTPDDDTGQWIVDQAVWNDLKTGWVAH